MLGEGREGRGERRRREAAREGAMGDEQVAKKGRDTSAFACLATASQPGQQHNQPFFHFFGRVAPYGTTNALLTPIESAVEVNVHVFLETLEFKASNHVGQSAICCPISKP